MTRQHDASYRTCSYPGCGEPVLARGWCSMHYQRVRKTGSPDGSPKKKPGRIIMHLPTRFWAKVCVDLDSGCWEWTGSKIKKGYGWGYGIFNVDNRGLKPHRLAYEALIGPIPGGMEIDHLCRNRGCCNPEHLEAVTHAVNMSRSIRALQTHCKRGHEFNEANTYRAKNGTRSCRRCHADRERTRQTRKRTSSGE